jgi:hypothetical protein
MCAQNAHFALFRKLVRNLTYGKHAMEIFDDAQLKKNKLFRTSAFNSLIDHPYAVDIITAVG